MAPTPHSPNSFHHPIIYIFLTNIFGYSFIVALEVAFFFNVFFFDGVFPGFLFDFVLFLFVEVFGGFVWVLDFVIDDLADFGLGLERFAAVAFYFDVFFDAFGAVELVKYLYFFFLIRIKDPINPSRQRLPHNLISFNPHTHPPQLHIASLKQILLNYHIFVFNQSIPRQVNLDSPQRKSLNSRTQYHRSLHIPRPQQISISNQAHLLPKLRPASAIKSHFSILHILFSHRSTTPER